MGRDVNDIAGISLWRCRAGVEGVVIRWMPVSPFRTSTAAQAGAGGPFDHEACSIKAAMRGELPNPERAWGALWPVQLLARCERGEKDKKGERPATFPST